MNILIVDDDTIWVKKFKHDVQNFFYDYEDKTLFDIYFKNDKSIPFHQYQLAFLDIDMGSNQFKGIEIAEELRKQNPSCYIVFVSAKNNLIHATLKIQPFFFIRKSNYQEDLDVFFTIFKDKIKQHHVIQLEYLSEQHVINMEDIVYVEAFNHSCKIYTRNQEYYDNRTLKSFLSILSQDQFVQIHRAIIINFNYLLKRTSTTVTMFLEGNQEIELFIGRTYRTSFNNAYKEMLLK